MKALPIKNNRELAKALEIHFTTMYKSQKQGNKELNVGGSQDNVLTTKDNLDNKSMSRSSNLLNIPVGS
jgi:hypothetical protein